MLEVAKYLQIDKEDILLFLNIVKCDYNEYCNFALRYFNNSYLGYLCIDLKNKGYIKVKDNKYAITNLGKQFLNQENKKMNRKGIDKNIGILNQYFIEKMDEDTVFIPQKITF